MKKSSITIRSSINNISTIKTDLSDVYVDKITGTDSSGNEIILSSVGEILNRSITCVYSENISVIHIYYDYGTDVRFDVVSSYSKYVRHGTINIPRTDILNNSYIKPIIDIENIGDAHISMKFNVQLYDENKKTIDGYEIYIPISSDSVFYTKEIDGRYTSRYAYIDSTRIDDETLIVERNDIDVFAIPINDHDYIKYENGIIHIDGINYFGAYISGTICVHNTNYTKMHHTPIIRNISMAIYRWI